MSKKKFPKHYDIDDNAPHRYGERSVIIVHEESGFSLEADLYYQTWRHPAMIDVGTGPFPYSYWKELGWRLDNDD